MARLIVDTVSYVLPPDTDLDQLADEITAATTARRAVAITVVGEADRELRLIINCGLVTQVVIDPAADGDGIITKGGRISGR
jgi:hypothetical protein